MRLRDWNWQILINLPGEEAEYAATASFYTQQPSNGIRQIRLETQTNKKLAVDGGSE